MNCFTVLGIEPTTEKKTIKRAYAAKSREFHPEEHPEEFQRIHDAYEEALAWAERNAGREEEPQMPEEPRRMEMGAAEQEKAAESETWNYAEPERNPEEAYMENPQKEDVQSEESSAQYLSLIHILDVYKRQVVDAATIVGDTMDNLLSAVEVSESLKGMASVIKGYSPAEKYELIKELIAPHLNGMFVTPKDIDETVRRISYTISEALNMLFAASAT